MRLVLLAVLLLGAVAPAQPQTARPAKKKSGESFSAAIETLRNTWMQQFNDKNAAKVAALYGPEAVLMRWDGTVHGHDSILADLEKSVRGGAHDYKMMSLHTEYSGDLGYDTGAYNVGLTDRTIEGNYVIVVKRIRGRWLIVAHAHVANPAVH